MDHVCTVAEPAEPPRECQTDGECPSKLACFNGHCDDPCLVIKPCGTNAKCSVIDTLPFRTMTCECLPGFVGNAYVECTPRKIFSKDVVVLCKLASVTNTSEIKPSCKAFQDYMFCSTDKLGTKLRNNCKDFIYLKIP